MADHPESVAVIGLGYVGLPLALALARHCPCWGIDIDRSRIDQLRAGFDRTGEADAEALRESRLRYETDLADCPPCEVYVVTVPTPIDAAKRPDLALVLAACEAVGPAVARSAAAGLKPIVVFESTVYPGVTEDICSPVIEATSGLVCGQDFFLGYSPERINPGDREHTVDRIVKIVAGQDEPTRDRLAALYSSVNGGLIHLAPSIKVAEAAKVIENAQRDINIAFMNEIAQIFARTGIATQDVLAAARTKWNFLDFKPGLVGGHCIGVDPFYLAHSAQQLGIDPQVILAGRQINDAMAGWIADELHQARGSKAGSVLILGLTFKENIPDLRNSKVVDMVAQLIALGHAVTVHDPHANAAEAERTLGFKLDPAALDRTYDLVILAVAHAEYLALSTDQMRAMVAPGGTLADLKQALGGAADWAL